MNINYGYDICGEVSCEKGVASLPERPSAVLSAGGVCSPVNAGLKIYLHTGQAVDARNRGVLALQDSFILPVIESYSSLDHISRRFLLERCDLEPDPNGRP